jgi:hypothetical protein
MPSNEQYLHTDLEMRKDPQYNKQALPHPLLLSARLLQQQQQQWLAERKLHTSQ